MIYYPTLKKKHGKVVHRCRPVALGRYYTSCGLLSRNGDDIDLVDRGVTCKRCLPAPIGGDGAPLTRSSLTVRDMFAMASLSGGPRSGVTNVGRVLVAFEIADMAMIVRAGGTLDDGS